MSSLEWTMAGLVATDQPADKVRFAATNFENKNCSLLCPQGPKEPNEAKVVAAAQGPSGKLGLDNAPSHVNSSRYESWIVY